MLIVTVRSGKRCCPLDNNRQTLIDFADQYLAPYQIKSCGAEEKLIPELCPLCHGGSHNKDKHTFCLFLNNGTFVCKRGSCGRHGRVEELAKELANTDIVLVRSASASSDRKQYVLPSSPVFDPTEQIYQYFKLRKISRETIDKLKIGSDMAGNIVFRFYRDGEEVFRKYRIPRKIQPEEKRQKEWQDSGTQPILWNMDECVFNQPLCITEGMIDALSLYESGITNVVSVPSGCSNDAWISNCWNWLDKFKTIVLFGDSDMPGRQAVDTWSKKLGEYRCLIVRDYPQIPNTDPIKYCKDANEVLYRFGESKIIEMVEDAEEIRMRGLIDVGDIVPYDPTTIPRISSGIPTLDQCIGGFMEGSLVVVSGMSGGGKSTITGQFMLSAIQNGHKVCAYSGELSKEKFLSWLCFQAAGPNYVTVKHDNFLNKNVPFVPPEIQQRIQNWMRGKIFLYDNKEIFQKTKAESIIEMFTLAVRRNGCDFYVVDNLMSSLCEEEEEYKAQTKFINALKAFAEKYRVSVICVAHPRKQKTGVPMGKFDVAGSANIVNMSDSTIVIERPDIKILKSRDSGTEMKIECVYLPDCRRIYEASVGDLSNYSWDKTGLEPLTQRACDLPEYLPQLSQQQPF